MNILLVHPEGNFNYNANLGGMLELLGEAGHRVTYVAPLKPRINQHSDAPWLKVVLTEHHQVRGRLLFPGIQREQDIDAGAWVGYELVVGVDRGIIDAAWLARHFGIPHALISYEIFFSEEVSEQDKAEEIEACRDLSFAVCQDALRSRKLCLANRIAPSKMLHIPVAGRGFQPPSPKPRLLHEQFGLEATTRIALYTGSLAEWTGASFLLKSTWSWPEDWVLVIHERFGPASATRALIEEHAKPGRVRISEATFDHPGLMTAFIQSADLGVALYRPTYEDEWLGRNLEFMGLSSGKICGYLQHGIPVATHELGELSDWIRFYGAGQVFSLDQPFVPELPTPGCDERCQALFEHHLDLDRFAPLLLHAVAHSRAEH